ncbi:MAG: chromate transporter [Pseudomonadota bacterium]
MLNLFLCFLQINLLTTSGPASIGLTKQLIVPTMISENDFSRIMAISSAVPGSDAIQMACQVGYLTHGFLGAVVAVLGALIPSLLLLILVLAGIHFIKPDILALFFDGVKPALAIMLIITAIGLIKTSSYTAYTILIIAALLFAIKIPLPVLLIICGLLGIWAKDWRTTYESMSKIIW